MKSEDGYAGRHGRHDQVLVKRIPFSEERDMQEHDRQKLAAFGENVRDVIDMSQGGVAKGGGERVGEGY